jgi:uncharacterized lipoprotein YmbA
MRALLLAAALAVAACGGDTSYYLLPPPGAAARQGSAGSIAVADISLPSYAGAIEIASLTGPGQAALAKQALWADTPQRALTRHLVASLEARLGARVLGEPWPGYDPPGLRIEVIVDRMIGSPGGGLEFSGQFVIVAVERGNIVAADRFALTVPSQGEGYPGLLAAHARAIELLADRIAARASGRSVPTA